MKKIFFSQLTKEQQLRRCVIPQHVSVTKNQDDEKYEQIVERQNKFITLSNSTKERLSSSETGNKIQEIGKQYNLQLLQLADISRAIRSYYFEEIRLEDFPSILSKEMGVDISLAKEISQMVIQKIINDNSQEEAYQAQLIKMSINDVLKNYPEILDQLITSTPIKIRGSIDPVRPTIKNWLSDYTYNLGYESHNSIVRGNYVFQNENAKSLSNGDRQKLSYILKSYDEKTPVTVDTARKQIVFPVTEMENIPRQAPQNPQYNNTSAPEPARKIDGAGYSIRPRGNETEKPDSTNGSAKPSSIGTSRPVYNLEPIPPAIEPTKPQNHYSNPQFQNNLEKKYEHPPLPQKPAFDSTLPVQNEHIKFSSPQKLPYEKEREKNHPPESSAPEPLRIHPVSSNGHGEEKKEELPRNVVNLRE